MWTVAVSLSNRGNEARPPGTYIQLLLPTLSLFVPQTHWKDCTNKSPLRVRDLYQICSPIERHWREQNPPLLKWDVPTESWSGNALSATCQDGGGAGGAEARGWDAARCHNGHPLWRYPFRSRRVSQQKPDQNRWWCVYLGVELLFHSFVFWCFSISFLFIRSRLKCRFRDSSSGSSGSQECFFVSVLSVSCR